MRTYKLSTIQRNIGRQLAVLNSINDPIQLKAAAINMIEETKSMLEYIDMTYQEFNEQANKVNLYVTCKEEEHRTYRYFKRD